MTMPVTIDGEEYLTTAEAAEKADKSAQTIVRWIGLRFINAHKDGSGRWLIKTSSVMDYLLGKRGIAELPIGRSHN